MILSLCILNWKRKKNVIFIVNNMANFNCINEILISNGNKNHSVEKNDFIETNKIKIFDDSDINNNYGLELRYVNALRANNDNVIIMDDDLLIAENELNKLIDEFKKNPKRIVGKWGRNIENEYNLRNCYNSVDVVLTKLLICRKKLFNLFFICKPLVEEIYKTGVPYGNGEDIFLSFIANIYFKCNGFCLDLNIRKLSEMNCAVSTNKFHLRYRKKLCNFLIKNKTKFIEFIDNLKFIII